MRELAARCLARAPLDGGNPTAIEGLSIYRKNAASRPVNAVYERSLFLVAQGRKQARVGDDTFVYDPDHYLVTSVPLPVVTQIVEASAARPFLSLAISFDLEAVTPIVIFNEDGVVTRTKVGHFVGLVQIEDLTDHKTIIIHPGIVPRSIPASLNLNTSVKIIVAGSHRSYRTDLLTKVK